MNYFMVNIILPEIDDDFISLLPQQRAFVARLIEKGLISSYSLADDRSRLWVIFKSDELNNVKGLLSCFPIIDKVVYDIVPLKSYQDCSVKVRSFSLN